MHKQIYSLCAAFILVFIALAAPPRIHAQVVSATAAGDLYGQALSINGQGIVLIFGTSVTGGDLHPILWKDGIVKDLTSLAGASISIKPTNSLNDFNEFVGTVTDNTTMVKGFYYDASGTVSYLTPSGNIQNAVSVEAIAINNRSQIVGIYKLANGESGLYLWQNGTFRTFSNPELAGLDSAYDINDNGVITGTVNNNGSRKAFMLDTALNPAVFSEIKYAGGDPLGYDNIEPRSINNANEIVGSAQYGGLMGSARAFHWANGVLTGLGTLPGGSISTAYSINNKNEIVGESTVLGGETHAFHYANGIMTDLGLLTHENSSYVSFGSVSLCINDAGTIVGTNSSYDIADPMSLVQHPVIFGTYSAPQTDGICKKMPKKIKKDKDLPPPFEGYCPEQ